MTFEKMQGIKYMLALAACGLAGMMAPRRTRPFFSGAITTVDATLVQETIDCSILRNQMGGGYGKSGTFLVPKLVKLEIEMAGGTTILDTAADRFDITITPTSQATHPHINDREVMFRHSEYTTLATGAATGPQGIIHLTKSWALQDAVVVTSQFFIQITLYATAQVIYYRVYYTWEKMSTNDIASQIFNQGIINA